VVYEEKLASHQTNRSERQTYEKNCKVFFSIQNASLSKLDTPFSCSTQPCFLLPGTFNTYVASATSSEDSKTISLDTDWGMVIDRNFFNDRKKLSHFDHNAFFSHKRISENDKMTDTVSYFGQMTEIFQRKEKPSTDRGMASRIFRPYLNCKCAACKRHSQRPKLSIWAGWDVTGIGMLRLAKTRGDKKFGMASNADCWHWMSYCWSASYFLATTRKRHIENSRSMLYVPVGFCQQAYFSF